MNVALRVEVVLKREHVQIHQSLEMGLTVKERVLCPAEKMIAQVHVSPTERFMSSFINIVLKRRHLVVLVSVNYFLYVLAVTVYHERTCGVGSEKGVLEISGLSSGTSASFEFVTYEDEDQTDEGYQNTGLWITDGQSSYGNWGTDHEGKLVYTRGSEEGTATVSETGNGIYAYVYPYTSDGSWCLDITVEGMLD